MSMNVTIDATWDSIVELALRLDDAGIRVVVNHELREFEAEFDGEYLTIGQSQSAYLDEQGSQIWEEDAERIARGLANE
jgi:hypothetical protein